MKRKVSRVVDTNHGIETDDFPPAVGNTRPTTVKKTVDNFFGDHSARSLYEKTTPNEANFALLRNRVSHLVTIDNFKVLI